MEYHKVSMYKDKEGRYRTLSLFKETITKASSDAGYVPVFTLKAKDSVLPSLRTAFILSEDPTGYTTAMDCLGSWEHWEKIFTNNKRFQEELSKWKDEQDVRIRSKAIKALKDTALQEGSKGTAAARYLADAGYSGSKRGRPSKAEITRERKQHAGITQELAEDEARVLRMVQK